LTAPSEPVPFDEHLASRVGAELATLPGFTERRMFGGLRFLLRGHLGMATASALARWLDRAISFVSSQPEKTQRPKPAPRARMNGK